jgi:hypothetical protein
VVRGQNCSSFTSLGFRALACGGLEMCCNVRGLLIGAFPNAPKRRNACGVKKIKTPCREVSKSINPICLFIFIHCQVSENLSKSGVWLAPNVGSYTQGRIAGDFLSSRKAARAERCTPKTTAAALDG